MSNYDPPEAPWEVVSWARLRKITGEAFSEVGKRNYGRASCIAVASVIAIGTSKGLILIFDFHQVLKATIGVGTRATESGPVTSVALSADVSTVAGGHANGDVFTWEIARPAKPILHISCTDVDQVHSGKIDGHVRDAAILHLGFLGTRHTALVSADEKGMAFAHLASRGLGAIARTVRTTRILGRYPEPGPMPLRSRKPSSVLAFAPLPLGNVENATESLGLVAMLTPYLLVVVSTTPVAQTQYKAARPREVAAHGAMTAAVAWYPAMRTKTSSFRTKLAYCWLNVVTILDVEEVEVDGDLGKDKPVELSFRLQKRWQAEESIVAMQWLNRSVLAILTVSQQLVILEDDSLAVTDSSDLIKKHVYHSDLFSEQLGQLVENLDEENVSMHGVVADAFYMSFKAYKGRLFLLGFNDVSVGTLSNWADRLFALMEHGDFIGAIQLATSYYAGGPDKAAIGLPTDDSSRHELVRDKLTELMSASLRYAFGRNPEADTSRVSESQLEHLAQACFFACLMLEDLDFLFEEVYTWYCENDSRGIFLRKLETCISDGEIRTVPPAVLKDLVNDFVNRGFSARLEEIICLLDPETMDLDQITSLCRRFKLHDALFYVWSQAIGDYVTVLKSLLDTLDSEDTVEGGEDKGLMQVEHGPILKIFTYLSYTLTGRIYPTGETLADDVALKAKADVYYLLFSGSSVDGRDPNSFHYLCTLLDLDTASFMSALNEAFEDNFLDESSERVDDQARLTEEQRFGVSLTRQFLIQVLLKVLAPPRYKSENIMYLNMFIARNQPKFPQFIRLPGSVLHRILFELCDYPSEDVAEDCQLSLEYLLSTYQPPDYSALLPLLAEARFFRIMKSIYRSEKQYSALLQTCFEDDANPQGIFEGIEECFNPNLDLENSQVRSLQEVLVNNSAKLLRTDPAKAAASIDANVPSLHAVMVKNLGKDGRSQFAYLREIFEERASDGELPGSQRLHRQFVELYVRLLCSYNPHHVSTFVDHLHSGDLRLDEVLPAMEHSGSIDAAVTLMAREGRVREAMDRLMEHLRYLEVALVSLVEGLDNAPDAANTRDNAEDLVESLEKYNRVGLWLCRNQTRAQTRVDSGEGTAVRKPSRVRAKSLDRELSGHETFWLDLLDSVVRISRSTNKCVQEVSRADGEKDHVGAVIGEVHLSFVMTRLRTIVQDDFTALLAITSTRPSHDQGDSNFAFLRILRAFLSRISQSSQSLVQLRGVLSAVFSAYAYEETLLSLANRLLDKDLFVRIDEVSERRKRGWRPSGQTCSGCGLRVWGPGAGAQVWDAWYEKQKSLDPETLRATSAVEPRPERHGKGKNKAAVDLVPLDATPNSSVDGLRPSTTGISPTQNAHDAIVSFSCRHTFHRRCLDEALSKADRRTSSSSPENGKQYRCPLE